MDSIERLVNTGDSSLPFIIAGIAIAALVILVIAVVIARRSRR